MIATDMNTYKKKFLIIAFVASQCLLLSATPAYAASTPALGQAASFGILSSTFTNTVGGTTITGDLGYTTGPAVVPTVNGITYSPPSSKYATAGTDQTAALAKLNGQACTYTFPNGAIDLATDTTHGPLGVYTPGVYCTGAASAASIGAAGITLSGSGTFIFKVNGALTTIANSFVTLSGASNCDVFWAPTEATTLGANSTFRGTIIDAAGITIGSTVTWTGRALAFGGTVSTDTDTLSSPTCAGADSPTSSSTTNPNSNSNSNSNSASSSTTGISVCPTINNTIITPIIIQTRRISPTSIFISWGPYSGTNTFNVRYGLANGNFLYNTNVTGFSTTLNDLPSNQPIWVQIAARNDCSTGKYGTSMLVGGTNSLGFPNTGSLSPQLPNAGFAPHKNTIPWYFQAWIFVFSSILLKQ